jgi:hypothetical protein
MWGMFNGGEILKETCITLHIHLAMWQSKKMCWMDSSRLHPQHVKLHYISIISLLNYIHNKTYMIIQSSPISKSISRVQLWSFWTSFYTSSYYIGSILKQEKAWKVLPRTGTASEIPHNEQAHFIWPKSKRKRVCWKKARRKIRA